MVTKGNLGIPGIKGGQRSFLILERGRPFAREKIFTREKGVLAPGKGSQKGAIPLLSGYNPWNLAVLGKKLNGVAPEGRKRKGKGGARTGAPTATTILTTKT